MAVAGLVNLIKAAQEAFYAMPACIVLNLSHSLRAPSSPSQVPLTHSHPSISLPKLSRK